MKLISNWRDAHKMASVQIGAGIGVLAILEQVVPALEQALPPAAYAVLSALMIVARVVLQPKLGIGR